jgi:hypothetical protein
MVEKNTAVGRWIPLVKIIMYFERLIAEVLQLE